MVGIRKAELFHDVIIKQQQLAAFVKNKIAGSINFLPELDFIFADHEFIEFRFGLGIIFNLLLRIRV
ncbi:hypothetical protein D3C73_1329050 [compost metagenome]